ncbi:MAG: divergent PAP2 family protein [Oscillospiraceae bacterium]|nr:divergent PAP2 family protein [Oscillospiraceae bacterium]
MSKKMEFFNPTLIAAILSWAAAQSTKLIINAVKYRKFVPERIFGAGGMPSSHASTVSALTTVIYRLTGAESVEFALSLTLALVVMSDAAGVRRAAGLHAKELNRIRHIVAEFENNHPEEKNVEEIMEIQTLKEYLGHTPLEVICGAALGITIGFLVN